MLLVPVLGWASSEYILGEGDIIKITVYGHQDLETVVRISGDGMINFPLLGRIRIAGMVSSQVSALIASRLSEGFIVDPQVSVFINEFRSQKAVIMGEVNRPGLYELKGATTFLELVSQAGGLSKDAGDTAIIKRKSPKNGAVEDVITIDLQTLVEKGDYTLDIAIADGDSIFIVKAGLFYVTGEVKKPDAYRFTEGTTVLKAITMAGGFTEKAAPRKLRLIRKIEGVENVFEGVPLDELVYPDDVIVVPTSFF